MRLVIVLAVAAAVTVMLGVILVAADVVMRLVTKRQPANMARLGLDVVAVGIAFGLVVLIVFAIARIGSAGGSRSPGSTADHRKGSSHPRSAASGGPGQPPGHGRAREQSHRERLRAGAPPAGGGHGGGRSARPPVLNPTHVYSPGGLIDVPRDGRAPGTPGGQDIPEILRTAGPGGRGQDRPSSARPGPHSPHPGYQPGMNPGGPGRGPYAPGGQPPPVPPREHMRSREAPRPAHGMPPRGAAQPQNAPKPQAPRPGPAGPPRESRLLRDAGPPREGMGPGGPARPGGPMPPRDPAYPAPPGQGPGQGQRQAPGQGSGPGRHAGGSGYAAPGGYRPGPAGSPRHGEAAEEFDGGYAKVIRASEHPVRPSGPARPPAPGRLSDPARSAPPADVYVYRDTEGRPGDLGSPAPGPDQNDPAYWYDLPRTGSAGAAAPGGFGAPGGPSGPGGSSGPGGGSGGPGGSGGAGGGNRYGPDEPRGPFEPLVSSADPPGTTPRVSASADALPIPGEPPPDPAHPAGPGPAHGEGQPGTDRARKLEQIKDLYLTAEAIGEANVDKHFDQLLAQQRELISEYFKQSGTARPADQAEAEPGTPGPGDTGAPVAADQPRA